jgi:hypothetical protein
MVLDCVKPPAEMLIEQEGKGHLSFHLRPIPLLHAPPQFRKAGEV